MDSVECSKAQFDSAVRVFREPQRREEEVDSIHERYGVNKTSIRNYFSNIKNLLDGERHRSNMTADLVERTLKWIGEDFGAERAKRAAQAVMLYVDHYLPRPQIAVRRAALAALEPDYIRSLDVVGFENSEAVAKARSLSVAERAARLREADPKPTTRTVLVTVFNRNPDVVATVLLRAGNTCEGCDKPAPFSRFSNGTPYLEVHHKHRLADGGHDTVVNAIALCANCHREAHFGTDRVKFTSLTPKG